MPKSRSHRHTHRALYRRLVALYPRDFRDEYGDDLVSLFEAQLREEPPGRVWGRAVRDLAVSVPTLHLEAHMSRPYPYLLPSLAGVVGLAAAVGALVVGTGPATPLFLVVALLAAAVAVWSFDANRSHQDAGAGGAGDAWWKFLVAGPAVAGVTFAGMAVPWPDAIDLGDNAYWLVFVSFLSSISLAGVGVLLGLGTLVRRRRG